LNRQEASTSEDPDVAIIGAGPAGLFAAELIAEHGYRVAVFDSMASPGRKFLLAGKGGLNITHSEPLEAFIRRYGQSGPHFRDILNAFPPQELMRWSEIKGEPVFVGSSGRVFPKSFRATPLLRSWLARLTQLGVEFRPRHRWKGWAKDGDLAFDWEVRAGANNPEAQIGRTEMLYRPKAVVFALGGASWPRLGSDGTWVAPFAQRGVAIAPLEPANCGVEIQWSGVFVSRFAGEPLKAIAVTHAGQTVRGEVLITKEGLEGGAIYALNEYIRASLKTGNASELTLDLRPSQTAQEIAAAFPRVSPSQSLANRLRKACNLSPSAIALLRETGLQNELFPLEANADQMASRIKHVTLAVSGFRPIDRAISSLGGVKWSELNNMMMLVDLPGHFVAGEMVDWTAPTGGYLLQACFATAYRASLGVTAWLRRN